MLSNTSWSSRTGSNNIANNNQQPRPATATTNSRRNSFVNNVASNNANVAQPQSSYFNQQHQRQSSTTSSIANNSPPSVSIIQNTNNINSRNPSQMQNNNNNNNDLNRPSATFELPQLHDLLQAVVNGGEHTTAARNSNAVIDRNLFDLLSGIVASVEVTNERVVEMSEQYQELSLEVATISRVIQSNQLQAQHLHQHQQSSSSSSFANDASINKRIGSVQTQHPTTTTTAAAAANPTNQSVASLVAENTSRMYLATESVAALHSHAVADLESKIDNLALRIQRLQDEVGIRSREVMDDGVADVIKFCDEERRATEEFLRETAATIEGQMAVRLAEAFAEKEASLNQTAQDAFERIQECSEELVTSFAQTSRAFIENTTNATTNCAKRVLESCATVMMDVREAALLGAHEATVKIYETESRMLGLYQNFEKLVSETSMNMITGNHNKSNNANTTTTTPPARLVAPLPFRCCSALDEVRALYNILSIDGAEAVRIFKEFVLLSSTSNNTTASTTSSLIRGNNNTNHINNNKPPNSPSDVGLEALARIRGGFTRNAMDALAVCLRTPMLRCLEPLPALGLQVADASPPTEGAEIVFVKDGGRAHMCGLRVGDIVMRVDGRELGGGAASRGGLHLALLTAPNRPLPNGVKTVLLSAMDDSTSSSSQQPLHVDRSSAFLSEIGANNNNIGGGGGGGGATRWLPQLSKQKNVAMSTANLLKNFNNSSSISGVQLTVYRFKDAMTFTCTMNLDP